MLILYKYRMGNFWLSNRFVEKGLYSTIYFLHRLKEKYSVSENKE